MALMNRGEIKSTAMPPRQSYADLDRPQARSIMLALRIGREGPAAPRTGGVAARARTRARAYGPDQAPPPHSHMHTHMC